MNTVRQRLLAAGLAVLLLPVFTAAQGQATGVMRPDAESLASGWAALAQGDPARAAATATELLAKDGGNHDALALAVAAFSASSRPLEGLDAYERWRRTARHEDLYLLQPVARALLREFAAGTDPRLRLAALAALAEAGEPGAQAELAQATAETGAPIDVETALAAAGDAAALGRLEGLVRAQDVRDKSSAIDALAEAGARGAVPAITAALTDPAPPTRMAAANALAEMSATEAVPALQALLKDPDPAVRYTASVALARLGQPVGGMTLEQLAASPIADVRLQLARDAAAADTSGQGTWSDSVRPLLSDPDPAVRLRAARLLLEHGRDVGAAYGTITAALASPSPSGRTEAARLLGRLVASQDRPTDIAGLRVLLRDAVADVRIQAAKGLLLAAGR